MSRKIVPSFLLALLMGASLAAAASAGGPQPVGVKGEILMFISDAEDKLNQLAEATPEDKFSWRPAEGVRSTGEVLMHVATANYAIPGFWGVKAPEGFNGKTFEKSLTRKADIQKALKESFVHVKNALTAATDEDLAKPAEFFGIKTTVRGGYLLELSHVHEHLGQSIAYARVNGIVPPWTAKQQAAAKAAGKKNAPM